MNNSSEKIKHILTAFILLLILADLLFSLYTVWDFTTDDAYISWRYASQLVNGLGFQWQADLPPVEGYSNFLWVILSALIIKMQLPLIISIKIISCFCLALTLIFLYCLNRLFLNRLLSTLPILIFSHYLGISWWTVSGLESMLYCALCLLFTWQSCLAFGYKKSEYNLSPKSLELHSTSSWILCNCALLLLSLTRFEGLVWVFPLVFFIACHYFKNPKQLDSSVQKKFYLWLSISLFCFILPYLGYFIWRVYYFGHWIPNSFSCKTMTNGQVFVVDFDYLIIILPLLVVSIPYLFSKQKDCRHILLWSPSLLYGIMLFNAHSVIAYFSRLFLAPFALFCLLPVLGLFYFVKEYMARKKNWDFIIVLAIVLLTYACIPGGEFQYLSIKNADYQERSQNRMAIVTLLNQRAKLGDSVYLNDCGIIPFYARSDLRFIDAQCLNNPQLTEYPYKDNLPLYAQHLMSKVKPNWIIINYYPEDSHGDYLSDLLYENGFYDRYELITTLQSGYFTPVNKSKIIDFVFQVYKRK